MAVVGSLVAVILLAVLLAGAWWTWRQPFIGLGLIVAGMSLHSFVLMVVLELRTPALLVRGLQVWKEALLAELTVIALLYLWRMRRRGTPVVVTDWMVAAFAVLAVIYVLIPEPVLHSGTSLGQRLVGFRVLALIPLLYLLGRTIEPRREVDRTIVMWLCVGAGAFVSLFGLFELFLVPTRVWLDWGVNLYNSWLGFSYGGPKGLPPNFFVTLPDGTLLRRMVSTYISPLGIAYTALLLFPIGAVLVDRQPSDPTTKWLAIGALTLVMIGLFFAVTRLAMFALIGEAGLMWLLLGRRWLLLLVPVLVIVTTLMLYPYASLGPAVDRNLVEVKRTHWEWAISGNDSSANEHYGFLVSDLKFDIKHPLGLGTGASIARYGELIGTGESQVLDIFGDLGWLGGALYVALYVLGLANGYRAFRRLPPRSLEAALPLATLVGGLALVPISVTSDLWGDLSVTFLFFWASGASATLAARRSAIRVREVKAVVQTEQITPVA